MGGDVGVRGVEALVGREGVGEGDDGQERERAVLKGGVNRREEPRQGYFAGE